VVETEKGKTTRIKEYFSDSEALVEFSGPKAVRATT